MILTNCLYFLYNHLIHIQLCHINWSVKFQYFLQITFLVKIHKHRRSKINLINLNEIRLKIKMKKEIDRICFFCKTMPKRLVSSAETTRLIKSPNVQNDADSNDEDSDNN